MLQITTALSLPDVLSGLAIGLLLSVWIWNSRTKSLKKRIVSLEREMLSNHAEILELQKEKTKLEQLLNKENPNLIQPKENFNLKTLNSPFKQN